MTRIPDERRPILEHVILLSTVLFFHTSRKYLRHDADATANSHKEQSTSVTTHAFSPAVAAPDLLTRTSMGSTELYPRFACCSYKGGPSAERGPPRRLRCGTPSNVESVSTEKTVQVRCSVKRSEGSTGASAGRLQTSGQPLLGMWREWRAEYHRPWKSRGTYEKQVCVERRS